MGIIDFTKNLRYLIEMCGQKNAMKIIDDILSNGITTIEELNGEIKREIHIAIGEVDVMWEEF